MLLEIWHIGHEHTSTLSRDRGDQGLPEQQLLHRVCHGLKWKLTPTGKGVSSAHFHEKRVCTTGHCGRAVQLHPCHLTVTCSGSQWLAQDHYWACAEAGPDSALLPASQLCALTIQAYFLSLYRWEPATKFSSQYRSLPTFATLQTQACGSGLFLVSCLPCRCLLWPEPWQRISFPLFYFVSCSLASISLMQQKPARRVFSSFKCQRSIKSLALP